MEDLLIQLMPCLCLLIVQHLLVQTALSMVFVHHKQSYSLLQYAVPKRERTMNVTHTSLMSEITKEMPSEESDLVYLGILAIFSGAEKDE